MLDLRDTGFFVETMKTRQAFNKSALLYDDVAALQREIGAKLFDRLDNIHVEPEYILDVGAGTGEPTVKLMKRYPTAKVVAMDIAPQMLKVAAKKAPFLRKMKTLCCDMHSFSIADNSIDMIYSNVAIQWSGNLSKVFNEFMRVLKPGGLLVYSTFGPNTLMELRESWAKVDSHTHVNSFASKESIEENMIESGFKNIEIDSANVHLSYTDVCSLMKDLKTLGANNKTDGRPRGMTGKNKFKKMLESYEKYRRYDTLPATYDVIYCHSWKDSLKV